MNKVCAVAVVGVLALAGCSSSPPAPVAAVSTPTVTVTQTVPGPAVTITVTPPPPPKPVVVAKPTIEEGQWEVGVDVPAGTYKLTVAVTADAGCYWSITQHATPDNIINNDIVTGGRPTVILKRGQDFTTNSCGTWTKVK